MSRIFLTTHALSCLLVFPLFLPPQDAQEISEPKNIENVVPTYSRLRPVLTLRRTARQLRTFSGFDHKTNSPYTITVDTSRKNKTTENNHAEQIEIDIGGNETLFDINFLRDFDDVFDPRNSSSRFKFTLLDASTGQWLDNAGFSRARKSGLIKMMSVPFGRWLPQTFGSKAVLASYDASVQAKQTLKLGDDNGQNFTIIVELQFMCKTFNTEWFRFPSAAVADDDNDPRIRLIKKNSLASCGFSLVADSDSSGLEFGVYATNRGIWAVYNRLSSIRARRNTSYDAFEIYRLLAWRDFLTQVLTARIEIDSQTRKTKYFLADQLVWTVSDWGKLTPALTDKPRNRLVSFSPATKIISPMPTPVPSSFTLYVRNMHKMDVADPNRLDNYTVYKHVSPALVRLNGGENFYSTGTKFYDEKSDRYSSLFGQGAVMGLKSLFVERRLSGHKPGAPAKMLITKHNKRTVIIIDESNVTTEVTALNYNGLVPNQVTVKNV